VESARFVFNKQKAARDARLMENEKEPLGRSPSGSFRSCRLLAGSIAEFRRGCEGALASLPLIVRFVTPLN
jgi:hypothetical protein